MKRLIAFLTAVVVSFVFEASLMYAQDAVNNRRLSNDHVTVFAMSDDGYMWIGTRRGLNRYNGTFYKQYTKVMTDIPSDLILSLLPDSGGDMYIGTDVGISLYSAGDISDFFVETSGPVYQMKKNRPGSLLFTDNKGLNMLDIKSGSVSSVFSDSRMSLPVSSLLSNRFLQTRSGQTFLYTTGASGSLFLLDKDYHYLRTINVPGGAQISNVIELSDGVVAIGTNAGLFILDGESLQFAALPSKVRSVTSGANILDICLDPVYDNIVVVEENKGIFSLNLSDDAVTRIWSDDDMLNVSESRIYTNDHSVFVSKNNNGFEMRNRQREFFVTRISSMAKGEQIIDILNQPQSLVLAVTDRHVYNVDVRQGGYRDYTPRDFSASDRIKGSFYNTATETLWLVINETLVRQYRVNAYMGLEQKHEYSVQSFESAWVDTEGRLCIIQGDSVLYLSESGESSRVAVSFPDKMIGSCRVGDKVVLYSSDAVYVMDKDNKLSRLPLVVKTPECAASWDDDTVIVGTRYDGLYIYSLSTGATTHMSGADGLSDRSIRSVVAADDALWVATPTQLLYIRRDNLNVTTYMRIPGQEDEFSTDCGILKSDDNVIFASGDILVEHRNWYLNSKDIPLTLDMVIVNSHEYQSAPGEEVVLSHDQNQIVFYYSCIDFNKQHETLYQYKLEGYDKEWSDPTYTNRASFSSLKPGRYVFKVRVRQYDGQWQKKELEYRFRIKPSLWASLPAVFMYILISLFLVWILVHQYFIIQKERMKMAKVEAEKKLAQRLDQERREFFTNISHEYRTPLSLIYGPIRELSECAGLDERSKGLVATISRNADRMRMLAERNLDYDKHAQGSDRITVRRTDAASLIRSVVELFSYELKDRDQSLTLDVPESLIIWGDREKLDVIFVNLLSNAIKYTPEGGSIKIVMCKSEDGMLKTEIQDNGIGISEQDRMAIFKRFERLKKTVGENLPGGYGIGLNYVQHLVCLLGGTIDVMDNKPRGSVFVVTVPCTREGYKSSDILDSEECGTSERAGIPSEVHKGEHTVMVVEDDRDMRDYISLILGDIWNVVVAINGDDAVNKLQEIMPDLIVSDVMMTGKNGLELCREVKESADLCHIPVVLLTAKTDTDSAVEGLEFGADAYIGKPFAPAYLKAVISGIFENRKKLQALLSLSSDMRQSQEPEIELGLQPKDAQFLQKLEAITAAHLADASFGVEQMTREIGMSRASLYSKTRSLLGQSVQEYLSEYRLTAARKMLCETGTSVSEVAEAVGFATINGFSKAFKNKYGIPPSSLRNHE